MREDASLGHSSLEEPERYVRARPEDTYECLVEECSPRSKKEETRGNKEKRIKGDSASSHDLEGKHVLEKGRVHSLWVRLRQLLLPSM
ncbi:hypothetical protein AMTR_s00158p00040280 [Amborella trichopoda]|uniref:Uncharacterized protein n=1 Tax=Amborella trichopoda TaxID=13333 RepID=W1PLP4_AMBTC|nr:hypothetical protein AMTR_s00158p00040280 [Amborella trichopoda]